MGTDNRAGPNVRQHSDIRPDVLVKGADWGIDEIVGGVEVESWGGKVVAVPLVGGKSTTGIVERVLTRYGNSRKTH